MLFVDAVSHFAAKMIRSHIHSNNPRHWWPGCRKTSSSSKNIQLKDLNICCVKKHQINVAD